MSLLERYGIIADIHETTSLTEATLVARKASGSYRLVLAGGGDGTISAVAAGLSGTGCCMGMIPFGSGNDVARGLHISRGLHASIRHLSDRLSDLSDTGTDPSDHVVRYIDTGQLTSEAPHSFFLNTLGVGFDGKVADNATHTRLFRGKTKYLFGVLKSLFTYRATSMTVTTDQGNISGRFLMVTVANGSYEGGGIRIAPEADHSDGLFNVVMIRDTGLWARIPLLIRVLLWGARPDDKISTVTTRHVRIETEDAVFVHADGEIISRQLKFITAKVDPGSLKMITGY